jgi:hypothetical protein
MPQLQGSIKAEQPSEITPKNCFFIEKSSREVTA